MSLPSAVLRVFYVVLYPPFYLISSALLLLWTLVSPFVSLGYGVIRLVLIPFKVLAKFEAAFLFIAVALLTGAVLGLTLHYTCTLTAEWLHQSLLSIALPRRKRDQEEVVTKLELEPQYCPQGAFEGEAALSGPTSRSDSFVEWDRRKDMNSLRGTQFTPGTILEEEEYSEDSTGY